MAFKNYRKVSITVNSYVNVTDIVFPVLDITRLAVRNEEINRSLCAGDSGDHLFTVLRKYLVPEALPANQMLALRVVTNMMCHKPGENLVMKEKHLFLFVIRKLANSRATKNLQVNILLWYSNFVVTDLYVDLNSLYVLCLL